MTDMSKVHELMDSFFNKQSARTGHETLATYHDNSLTPGGIDGAFYTHINYYSMRSALIELINKKKSTYTFVETGCSSHGTKSTLLWDKFVNIFGGKVSSVDLDGDAVQNANRLTTEKTNVIWSDSLNYLPTLTETIDFLYLDSYDVDFLNPLPSAEHHLKEFNSVKHLLEKGSVVLIDDTPCSPEWLDGGRTCPIYNILKDSFRPEMCGKGSLVNKELEKMGAKKILHQYQILWII